MLMCASVCQWVVACRRTSLGRDEHVFAVRESRLVSRTSPEEALLIILDIRALVAGKRRQRPLGRGLEKSSADRSIPPLKRGA